MNLPLRILLGQLGAYGDCLYATAIARQIKHDYPGCRLTWAIASVYRSILDGNPFVDDVWEIPCAGRAELDSTWVVFERDAFRRLRKGDFDHIFLTQISPDNYQNFDGTVRASIFRGYPHPITLSVTPVVRLADQEVATVKEFAELHHLDAYSSVILFECAATSSQTFVTPEYALAAARGVIARLPGTAILLSSTQHIDTGNPQIIDASALSFRANAELTKYCSLFVGCSSGVSWLCTSDWARPLPMIQLLKASTSVFASMVHDAEYFGRRVDNVLEMTECPPERLTECICVALESGFARAREVFHQAIPLTLNCYIEVFLVAVLKRGQVLKVLRSLRTVARRYGMRPFYEYVRSKFSGTRLYERPA